MKTGQLGSSERGPIYTLAQSGTKKSRKPVVGGGVLVSGKGADANDKKVIHGRARRKQITQAVTASLISLAEKAGNDKLLKTLWNTHYCLNRMQLGNDRLFGKYCKNRICTVCLCIRKAEILNKYLPVIQKWKDPHFVTLTVKAVPAKKLKGLIENMSEGFSKIIETHRKRAQRNKGFALMGIRSLECNFNPQTRTYNPHFHLIVPDRETAEILLKEWLRRSKKGWTVKWAQNITRITDKERCLIEVVKYGSKIFTEQDVNKKSRQKSKPTVYAKALYTILTAMQWQRIFDRFGFNLPKPGKAKLPEKRLLRQSVEFLYDRRQCDWVEERSGSTLAGYVPQANVSYLLENCIDVELN